MFSLFGLNIQQQQKKTSKVARLRFAHLFVLPNHFGKVAFECLGFRWVLANVPRFFLAKNCPRFVHCFGFFLEWGNLLNYHDQNLNIGIIKGHGFFLPFHGAKPGYALTVETKPYEHVRTLSPSKSTRQLCEVA